MKRKTIYISVSILAMFVLIYFVLLLLEKYENYKEQHARAKFEQEIVEALDLKFINKDSLYGKSYVRVFQDTIVGCKGYFSDGTEPRLSFIQAIHDSTYTVTIPDNNSNNRLRGANYIDQYINGCMYFGSFGGSTMQQLCKDGSRKEFFKAYEDTLFYANKVLIYKDKAAITSMNGIYIFSLNSEKLLWRYTYKEFSDLYDGPSVIIQNKFIFSDIKNRVTCINLDNLKVEWRVQLSGNALHDNNEIYHERNSFYYNDKIIALPGTRKFMLIDRNSGELIWTFPWEFDGVDPYRPKFEVTDKLVYFTYPSDLKCIDYIQNKIKWQYKNATFRAIYKDNVIAVSKDSKYYLIIDKNTGKLKKRISNPNQGYELSCVDKYVIVYTETLYE